MTLPHPYYEDEAVTIYQGNVLDVLPQLNADSVQCVVTSPPYWGLRKYAGEQEFVWGENHCEHEWHKVVPAGYRTSDTKPGALQTLGSQNRHEFFAHSCSRCGAWRGAYGLEPTVEMYVEHTVLILREIRRVLRPDGVVFWNIGDSYAAGKGMNGSSKARRTADERGFTQSGGTPMDAIRPMDDLSALKASGLKPKDLCLIPFRVALAAQGDGWWVRSVIIWSKPNPMPESVTDRPTESHEYIIMLTRSARYYWDQEAVREPYVREWDESNGGSFANTGWMSAAQGGEHRGDYPMPKSGRNIRSVWESPKPVLRLRHDLSPSDRVYVLGELLKRGILSNSHGNENDQNE